MRNLALLAEQLETQQKVVTLIEILEREHGTLNEISFMDVIKGAGHIGLDLAGFIPGFGEIADVLNAVWYAAEDDWLYAALSLISVIPEIGDIAGKGLKYMMQAGKVGKTLSKGNKAALKSSSGEAVEGIKKFREFVSQNQQAIDAGIDKGLQAVSAGAEKIENNIEMIKSKFGEKAAAIAQKTIDGLKFLSSNSGKIKQSVDIFAKAHDSSQEVAAEGIKRLGRDNRSIACLAEEILSFPGSQRFELDQTKSFITNLVQIDHFRNNVYRELEGLFRHPDTNIVRCAKDALQDFDLFLNQRKELSIRLHSLMKLLEVPSSNAQ